MAANSRDIPGFYRDPQTNRYYKIGTGPKNDALKHLMDKRDEEEQIVKERKLEALHRAKYKNASSLFDCGSRNLLRDVIGLRDIRATTSDPRANSVFRRAASAALLGDLKFEPRGQVDPDFGLSLRAPSIVDIDRARIPLYHDSDFDNAKSVLEFHARILAPSGITRPYPGTDISIVYFQNSRNGATLTEPCGIPLHLPGHDWHSIAIDSDPEPSLRLAAVKPDTRYAFHLNYLVGGDCKVMIGSACMSKVPENVPKNHMMQLNDVVISASFHKRSPSEPFSHRKPVALGTRSNGVILQTWEWNTSGRIMSVERNGSFLKKERTDDIMHSPSFPEGMFVLAASSQKCSLGFWDMRMLNQPCIRYEGLANDYHRTKLTCIQDRILVCPSNKDKTVRFWDMASGGHPLKTVKLPSLGSYSLHPFYVDLYDLNLESIPRSSPVGYVYQRGNSTVRPGWVWKGGKGATPAA